MTKNGAAQSTNYSTALQLYYWKKCLYTSTQVYKGSSLYMWSRIQ